MKRLALACVGLLLVPCATWAENTTRQETLERLGKSVKRVLEGRDLREIRLGALVGDTQPKANAGAGLLYDLQRILATLEVRVSAQAVFELRGRYELVRDRKLDRYAIEVALEIYSEKTGVVQKLKGYFTYLEEVLQVAGLTAEIPPNADSEQVAQAISRATDDAIAPPIAGSEVFAAKNGDYAIELLVRNKKDVYESAAPFGLKGMPFVNLKKDDVYAVRLINHSNQEAAATLSIDGLNVFSFASKFGPDSGGYPRILIPAKQSRVIKGWPSDLRISREFLVASYPETAAFMLQKPSTDLGIVSAAFVMSWEKGNRPKNARSASGPLGTGRGETIQTPFVMTPREFGDAPTSIHIRYTAKTK